jgi:hypothetical protein
VRVEERTQPSRVPVLDRAIRERERRRRPLELRDAGEQLVPARAPVPVGEVAPRFVDVDAADGRDPLGAALVVLDVGAERLLDRGSLP